MPENPQKPREYDAVLGGENPIGYRSSGSNFSRSKKTISNPG
ncbi:hypothetical protein [Calothrix sp. CCY 0018]